VHHLSWPTCFPVRHGPLFAVGPETEVYVDISNYHPDPGDMQERVRGPHEPRIGPRY
jgi:hypothetical protein